MNKIDKYLSDELKKSGELEGGLFAEISLSYCGRDYVARRDLYTVKNGEVYTITKDDGLFATGDSLWNLKRDCHKIGKFNPAANNLFKSRVFSYSEIKMLLGL